LREFPFALHETVNIGQGDFNAQPHGSLNGSRVLAPETEIKIIPPVD